MTSVKNQPIIPVYKHFNDQGTIYLKLNFNYLPSYAKFLIENKLHEFVKEQLHLSKKIELPLLKFLKDFSEEQLIKLGLQTTQEFLNSCAENKAEEYIKTSVERWLSNQLPAITKNQIVAEDITLLSFLRRTTLRHFVSSYTADITLGTKIMDEIDKFTTKIDSISFKIFSDIQKQMFAQAQALAHIGNWQWDLKTKKLAWSDELYNIYEIELQSEINSEKIALYNHPEDAELVRKHMQWSAETLSPHDFFYRIILKNGQQKILHAKVEVKLDSNQSPVEMFGTLQDVTEQKQKENELEESKKFIEKIANVSPCIITVYNKNSNKYIFVNNTAERLLGYTAEEFMNKGRNFFYSLMHPDDIKLIKEKNIELLNEANKAKEIADENIKELKYRLKHKDGNYRWINTFTTVFSRNKKNKVENILNISLDVTESHFLTLQLAAIHEEVKQKEKQHQLMINSIDDYAILLLDKNGIIQNWNKGAEKINGYSENEIIGQNFGIFYSEEDNEKKLPELLIEQATLNGKASHEGWRVRRDGTAYWGNTIITALHDEDDNVIGFSKVTRDLTERKLAEDKLKEYAARIEQHNIELQRINKELDSFTYTASHDLQEPLRKIKTFCNFIISKENESLSADTKTYFDKIGAATSRMQKLIESLLHYSRATTAEIILEPTDLNSIIAEVEKDLAEVIAEKKATIITKNLPVLKVMPFQFHQLFFNIIGNAIKYQRESVPPVIEVEAVPVTHATETGEKFYYKIIISDNGIGFEQEYADNIFKLFQRLHGRSEYSGTGIGLAICKKIAENHHGTITATSEPGKGSTFTILIPVEK